MTVQITMNLTQIKELTRDYRQTMLEAVPEVSKLREELKELKMQMPTDSMFFMVAYQYPNSSRIPFDPFDRLEMLNRIFKIVEMSSDGMCILDESAAETIRYCSTDGKKEITHHLALLVQRRDHAKLRIEGWYKYQAEKEKREQAPPVTYVSPFPESNRPRHKSSISFTALGAIAFVALMIIYFAMKLISGV